jgi:hypothetical protein
MNKWRNRLSPDLQHQQGRPRRTTNEFDAILTIFYQTSKKTFQHQLKVFMTQIHGSPGPGAAATPANA